MYSFVYCDEGTRDLYNELKERILSISPTISIKAKKMYIAFTDSRNFVYLKPKRSELELHLSLKKGELNDPKKIAEDLTNKWHGSTDYGHAVKIGSRNPNQEKITEWMTEHDNAEVSSL